MHYPFSPVTRLRANGRKARPILALGLYLSLQVISVRAVGADGATRMTVPAEAGLLLAQELRDAVDRGDTSCVVALVVDPSGVRYQASAGHASVAGSRQIPEDAIFLIASMTKPITSVAAMILVEEGRLGLDDPVSKYLSGFDQLRVISTFNSETGAYETRPARRAMTVRHLLAHTSGIGYSFASPIVKRLTESSHKNEWELPLLSDPVKPGTTERARRYWG